MGLVPGHLDRHVDVEQTAGSRVGQVVRGGPYERSSGRNLECLDGRGECRPAVHAPVGVSTRGVSSSCQRFGSSVERNPR